MKSVATKRLSELLKDKLKLSFGHMRTRSLHDTYNSPKSMTGGRTGLHLSGIALPTTTAMMNTSALGHVVWCGAIVQLAN